ncbi:MAG: 30S ribosomal protein S6 [Anaerolineales bacterium]
MRTYELMFILSSELNEEETKAMEERIQGYLENAEAEVFDFKDVGLRRLAYEIKHQREGRYYLAHFKMDPQRVKEFERNLQRPEAVLRELITCVETAPASKQGTEEAAS